MRLVYNLNQTLNDIHKFKQTNEQLVKFIILKIYYYITLN